MKVEELIETLGHQDQDVRRGAVKSLGEIGEDAKDAVSALSKHYRSKIRMFVGVKQRL